ncbi:MAG: alpha/beta hydrolase-fold protein [Candidatus Aminicenantes bacterium]|nr:alpha/beta hydrolase-fold protein [Candidatus Aminicenantes bacterium]
MALNSMNLKRNVFFVFFLGAILAFLFACQRGVKQTAGLHFGVSFPDTLSKEPLNGRVLLMFSSNGSSEPRFQISVSEKTQIAFGVDVEDFKPNDEALFDAKVFGYPLKSMAELPPGEYWVQAMLDRYETFHRSDSHVVKLPMDRGEGRQWNLAPGNYYSTPRKIAIDPRKDEKILILLDKVIPPLPDPEDTRYIKHVKLQSQLLTKFWGRPFYIGASVLLPEGYDEHPQAHFPLFIFHDHFSYDISGFSENPPDPEAKGRDKEVQELGYQLYNDWRSPNFPRMVVIKIQHATPYYDDSYAVNSANLGPYGDAITYELIPFIEKKYHCIGQGWARTLTGGSTGGWEAIAAQIFYPDEYNGCWSCAPDPIDFRAFELVNIYEHKNAYYSDSEWKPTPRPAKRNEIGEISSTIQQRNQLELVLGTRGRSGEQWDIWQAVYSPVDQDGYPLPIWDKLTGVIDHTVAEYWKEHYDLRYILERDWKTLGPKLKGKIRIYVGDMDYFYLNNAVYLMEDFLKTTKDPYYDGNVEYGDRFGHCWSGDHVNSCFHAAFTYIQRFAPEMKKHILKTAPPGADTTSWQY